MRAFIKFNKGMMKMPVRWQLWLMLMVAVNLVVPLFFLDHLEAQVVIGVLLASMTLMMILTARVGFTRLLGLGHIFWFPLLYFLWTRLDQIPADLELAAEYAGQLKVSRINVDDSPQTPAHYGVRGIPTLILFKGGKAKGQIVGAVPKAQLVKAVQGVLEA